MRPQRCGRPSPACALARAPGGGRSLGKRSRLMSSEITDALAPMCPDDIAAVRQAGDPRVSPDGRTIAFTVTDPDLAANRYTRRIWLAAADADAAGGPGAADRPWRRVLAPVVSRWDPAGLR